MPSFDIVNQLDLQEIDNAVNMVKRDIATRYDFKGSSSSITLSKSDKNIIINGDVEYQIDTIFDMLQNRAISRKVSVKVFKSNETENASGMTFRKKIDLQSGISKENGKKINVMIKEMKLKVNSQIQGEHVRVTGKKIDDLQSVMNTLKEKNLDIPLQFVNMKS
ncbi:MAG: YajQ family cyclic di-GMP-binding protein [Candidatus Marinimicrobia bacterium]|nr:YajQ family cyclic di-GMP-binding protein [Candidatus Neomarinimicrobiota bacterium]|tara:strand:- start:1489 stop:1980 length:492 start_codon:yes stop_codon:yes gene_type:complete